MIRALAFTPTGPGVFHLDTLRPSVAIDVTERCGAWVRDAGLAGNELTIRLTRRHFRLRLWRCPVEHMNPDWLDWPGCDRVDALAGREPYYLMPVYREDL